MKLITTLLLLTQCACTTSYKKNSLALIGSAVAVGFVIGSAKAPEGENPTSQGILWSGLLGTAAGLASPYVFQEELISEQSVQELDSLRAKVKFLESKSTPKEVITNPNAFSKPLPQKFQHLVEPGGWKIYEIDEWIRDGETRLIHQDKMIEVEMPQIKGGGE